MCQGCWQPPQNFALASHVSLDQRLRELVSGMQLLVVSRFERQEHLALLARWYYSNPRDGEIFFREKDWPYRRMMRGCSRLLAPKTESDSSNAPPALPAS